MDDGFSPSRITLQESIILNKDQIHQLKNHAEKNKPNESSALLFGSIEDDSIKVSDLFLAKNSYESPVNFTMDPQDVFDANKIAEEKKLKIVGVFHSHPNSEAYPSNTDKKFMQANPFVWIIYSGIDKNFKAFILENDVKEIQIT